jgi:ribosomal protein S18 acetylase RimI-like enzyme
VNPAGHESVSANLAIRRATVADAQTLSRIATRTFIETFGHLYPDEDLQAFLRDSYAVDRQALILGHPDYAVWLLERDGEALGHAAAGPCGLPHADVQPGDGELKRLYVLPEAQNGGWGGKLFQTALAWLERDGPRTLWIGVWSQNLGAQRLYARHGFEHVGAYEFPVGRVRDHEFILRRLATTEPRA